MSSKPSLKTLFYTLTVVIFLGAANGCVYRQDVQQGNEITQEMVDKIKPGMSRREVIRILGYPLINDPFNRNRWDYYYSLKVGRSKSVTSQSATLVFKDDSLQTIDSRIVDSGS